MRRFVKVSSWLSAVGCVFLAATVRAAEDEPRARNPFWPTDYEGTRYVISAEPRFKPEPPKPEETNEVKKVVEVLKSPEAPKDPMEDPVWNDAIKVLRFGSAMGFSADGQAQVSVMINDRAYVVGDLVSANFGDGRFTWKIESLSTDGKIKLKRITYRKIGVNP